MRIAEILARRHPCFSFEFFPPKTDEGVEELLGTVRTLRALDPAYVSVTYGAGGSSRARTIEVAKRIKRELGIEVLAHVTCLGSSRDDLRRLFDELAGAGIENVLALRGDAPKTMSPADVAQSELRYATDLIELLAAEYRFCIGAAAYPEMHQEAVSVDDDLRNAARKVALGAEFLVTQLFFDNRVYLDFVRRARDLGITIPIVPGIMPITGYAQIARMTEMSGATIPAPLRDQLEARIDQADATRDLGVAFATLQCSDLLENGAPGIHFYTLNKSTATRAVVSALLAAREFRVLAASR